MHLLHYCSFCCVNCCARAYQTYLTLDIPARRRGDIDLAAGSGLHILDGFAACKELSAKDRLENTTDYYKPLPMIIPTASEGTTILSLIFSPVPTS